MRLYWRLLRQTWRHCLGGRGRGRRANGSAAVAQHLQVRPDVAAAISSGCPVVALETTLVTHGMPHPDNLTTALELEHILQSLGVVPATIGILDGTVYVGMTTDQLERLADPSLTKKTLKVSRRDLPYVLSQGYSGGTTVSATMMCAHRAGIPVFVTGGIGGVHRMGEDTLDISADLMELGRTPVAVVCGGVKSILDIGRTLEVLETQGVTVMTYGPTRDFPAFFSQTSGFHAPFNVQTPLQCARVIDSSLSFGLGSGALVTVPIPTEAACLGEEIEQAIQQALSDAKNAGVTGKAVTPFVLQRVNEITGGKSLTANIELVKNNARVGGKIALELAKLRSRDGKHVGYQQVEFGGGAERNSRINTAAPHRGHKNPVVIGASIADFMAKISSSQIKAEGTNPGTVRQSFGGVGRNIAECLARLGTQPLLISAIGSDGNGWRLAECLRACGIPQAGIYQSRTQSTAAYCAVLDGRGELYCAVGDMEVNGSVTPEWVSKFSDALEKAPFVCMDGNVPMETIKYVCDLCWEATVPVWYEPTCVDKSVRPIVAGCLSKLTYTTPNLSELRTMHSALTGQATPTGTTTNLTADEKLRECQSLLPSLLPHVPNILVSLGPHGLVCGRWADGRVAELLHYPPASPNLLPVKVTNVTGAGDSFVGGMISSLSQGLDADSAIKAGLRAAYLSLHSYHAVSDQLHPELFTQRSVRDWAPWQPSSLLCRV